VGLGFKENSEFGVTEGSSTFGTYTADNPVRLYSNNNGDSSRKTSLTAGLLTSSFSLADKQNYFKVDIQKYNEATRKWEDSTNSDWSIQASCPYYFINNIQNSASGKYRIGVAIKNMTWKNVSGNMFSPVYSDEVIASTQLYDWNSGKGVLYVEFNKWW
jgi:hypothetical protein